MAVFHFESNYPNAILSVWIEENNTGKILTKTDGLSDATFITTNGAIPNIIIKPNYKINYYTVSTSTPDDKVLMSRYGTESDRYRSIGAFGTAEKTLTFNLTQLSPDVVEKGTIKINGDNVTSTATNTTTQEVIPLTNNTTNDMKLGTYNVNITAISGYEITNAYTLNRFDNEVPLTISDDKTTTSKTVTVTTGSNSEIYIVTSKKEVPPIENPPSDNFTRLNNVYNINHEILNQFTTERFTKLIGSEGNMQVIDLAEYIINIIELPVTIPSDSIGESELIKLGDYNINTMSPTVNKDEVIINLGTIHVNSVYKNSLDYLNTTILLHLPFMNSIELNPNYVIDCDVKIQYIVDLYTSSTTLLITSSKTGKMIFNDKIDIGRQIPFLTAKQKQIGTISEKSGVNNNLNYAYIEVIRNVPYDINKFDLLVNDTGLLKDEKGNIIIEDIDLITDTTLEEKEKIKNILQNGVNIK